VSPETRRRLVYWGAPVAFLALVTVVVLLVR
jgi:cytochrome c-type biogenesis protein CcmH/NrfF